MINTANSERVNSNLIDANIKLLDENKLLKKDNELLQKRLDKALEIVKNRKENGVRIKVNLLYAILTGEYQEGDII